MGKFILAIDQGTTGTTATLMSRAGQAVAQVNREHPQIFPQPGWVEHDPEAIWQSVVSTIQNCLEKGRAVPTDVAAIGITNQRETVVAWDRRSGKPVCNAIVWQCRRTSDFCEKLRKKGLTPFLHKRTGLVIDPYFSGSKMRWILDHVPEAKALAKSGHLAFGTIDTFLIWRLTGGKSHITDVSNASRTQLMNLARGEWDKECLKLFQVPESALPQIVESSGVVAHTRGVAGIPDGVPIAGIAGDQQSALFGQACFQTGQAKCTFGTGSFLLLNIGDKPALSKGGILTTVAWRLKGQKKMTYALEGGAFVCGAAVQWLRDGLGFIKTSREVEDLAASVEDSGGVEFVPALTGLGAPHWKPEARGLIAGLTRGTNRAHIARATLEAMALQNVEILLAMQKGMGKPLKDVRVDGGAVANDLLMQLQADYLGKKILRPKNVESTSAGAAYLAGLGVGMWSSTSEIAKVWSLDREFTPKLSSKEQRKRLERWQLAVSRAVL